MDIFIRILMGLEAIVCLLLIGIVLLQRSKGQGVGLSFGGGAEAVFGAQMGNVLTRGTVILAVIFLLNTTLLAVLRPKGRSASVAERIEPVAPAPAAPAAASTAEDSAAALELLGNEAPAAPAAATPASPAVVVPAASAPAVVVSAPSAPAVVVPAAPAPAVVVPATPAPAPVAPAVVVPAATAPVVVPVEVPAEAR